MAQKFNGPSPTRTSYGSTFTTGDTISILLDANNRTLEFWKNGVSMGVAFTGINVHQDGIVPIFHFWNSSNSNGGTIIVNMNRASFKYDIPVGYLPYDNVNILVFHEGKFKTYSSRWLTISTEEPTVSQFVENGIGSIERRSTALEKVSMNETSKRIFHNSLDIKNLTGITDVAIEVKS